MRQIREADNQVDHIRGNAANFNRRHLRAPQEHPQVHRARQHHAENEERPGERSKEEEKARQERQAPPPQKEDAGRVVGCEDDQRPLVASKRACMVGALCRRAKRSDFGQSQLVPVFQYMPVRPSSQDLDR